MSFLKSAINQVGRDMGKVLSNQVFNNSHSTPYRRVSQNARFKTTTQSKSLKSDFDKAIDFQTGHRPSTLIAKISGVYTVIKNEANQYISDGYLDTSESASLFEMMNRYNMKIDDVCDVMEIDEVANEKEINQLTTIVEKTNKLFKETLRISADGCIERKSEHEIESNKIENVSFLNFVGLHLIWMGKYARGQEKYVWKSVLANLFDIITLTFPFTRVYLLLKGVFTFPSESKRRKTLRNAHNKLAKLEGKRAESYLNIG